MFSAFITDNSTINEQAETVMKSTYMTIAEYWKTNNGTVRYVSATSGSTSSSCTSSSPCQSLYYAYYAHFDSYTSPSSRSLSILLMDGTHTRDTSSLFNYSASYNSFNWTITISPYNSSTPTLQIPSIFNGTYLFQLSTGSLSLSDFTLDILHSFTDSSPFLVTSYGTLSFTNMLFKASTLSTPIRNTFIQINKTGTLNSTNTTFSDVTVSNRPFISSSFTNTTSDLSALNIRIVDSSFTNITRSSGDGGILSLLPYHTPTVFLSNTTFHSCSCNSGGGGAFYINRNTSLPIEFSQLTFTNCSSSENGGAVRFHLYKNLPIIKFTNTTFTAPQDKNGGCIYITFSDGFEFVQKTEWIEFITESYDSIKQTAEHYLLSEENITTRTPYNASLFHFLYLSLSLLLLIH